MTTVTFAETSEILSSYKAAYSRYPIKREVFYAFNILQRR
jgi:hypothetical protein